MSVTWKSCYKVQRPEWWPHKSGNVDVSSLPHALGMGDTSYFIFDTIPIFSRPVSLIAIPIPLN